MNKKIVILSALFLVACQTTSDIQLDAQPELDVSTSKAVAVANSSLSTDERLREAFRQLELGDTDQARAEIDAYLIEKPKGRVANDLLKQIDLPSNEYYPDESFEVTLESGQTLSTLAEEYLGTAYQFYALAKYNNIDKPGDLDVGQIIRIPLTDHARQTLSNPVSSENQVLSEESVEGLDTAFDEALTSEENDVVSNEQESAELIDEYYKQASIAFRRQELDKAIALWDKVLLLDPEHQHAITGRLQALELKRKLSNLQ